MAALGALIFEPRLVPKVWGAERWLIYDRPEASALVAEGPFKGMSLNALMQEFGPALLGEAAYRREPKRFPLMAKLIEAKQALSLQVHPGDAQAASMVSPDEPGKSEAWVVLKALPGARLSAGFKPGTGREAYLAALKSGALPALLNEFEVKAGDAVLIPAGQVHAIGAGVTVYELQRNADTTWRIHDYGRLEGGEPRPLHLSQALECIDFSLPPSMPLAAAPGPERLLAEDPHFKLSRLEPRGGFKPPQAAPGFHILSVAEGLALLDCAGERLRLPAGATALVPACAAWSLAESGPSCAVLWGRPGSLET